MPHIVLKISLFMLGPTSFIKQKSFFFEDMFKELLQLTALKSRHYHVVVVKKDGKQ